MPSPAPTPKKPTGPTTTPIRHTDDYITARGANPRTGLISPSLVSQSSRIGAGQEAQECAGKKQAERTSTLKRIFGRDGTGMAGLQDGGHVESDRLYFSTPPIGELPVGRVDLVGVWRPERAVLTRRLARREEEQEGRARTVCVQAGGGGLEDGRPRGTMVPLRSKAVGCTGSGETVMEPRSSGVNSAHVGNAPPSRGRFLERLPQVFLRRPSQAAVPMRKPVVAGSNTMSGMPTQWGRGGIWPDTPHIEGDRVDAARWLNTRSEAAQVKRTRSDAVVSAITWFLGFVVECEGSRFMSDLKDSALFFDAYRSKDDRLRSLMSLVRVTTQVLVALYIIATVMDWIAVLLATALWFCGPLILVARQLKVALVF